MSDTRAWQALLATALVGTDRQSMTAAASSDVELNQTLAQLREQVPPLPDSKLLLLSAAAVAAYTRAGSLLPHPMLPAGDQARVDTMPALSRRAEAFLESILGGNRSDLLAEFLAAASRKGLRIPEAFLPALLDAGDRHSDLRPRIRLTGGERLQWLAAQNPD